jgi:hypothetical protein
MSEFLSSLTGAEMETAWGLAETALQPGTAISTVSGLQTALDGKSATTHNHAGTYEPADATILKEADIGASGGVQGYSANTIIGDGSILSVVALTQAAYDALTPVATTLYMITD